ncbi:MAG: heavy metal translocating P-type ATPase [Pontimonas sp.]|nr:heavy metal translocating P-type ATPase [Pontimonas sp.]
MSLPIQLDIEGMTCASCATRIEKALNKVEGVEASVNYATEQATVLGDAPTEALLTAIENAGYHAHVHSDEPSTGLDPMVALRTRLIISASMTLPVMVLSMVPPFQFLYWQWLVFALAVPVATWGAWPFHRAAAINARHGVATMDTLISVGVGAALGWSLYALFFGGAGMPGMTMTLELFGQPGEGSHEIYLEVAAAVTTFMLLGRYLEHRAKRDAGAALRALMESGAKEATVLRNGVEKVLPLAVVKQGDVMVVRPGERIPTDGEIVEGAAAIDTSMMTGESVPVEATVGDSVLGGTINTSGLLKVRATRVGDDTELARMAKLVERAQTGKSDAQRLADRISAVFVPIVIVVALVTFAAWMIFAGSLTIAFQAAVATLIIACPCALGLATPTALLVGTGRGAQLGLLISGPEVLERSRSIDMVVLDKTGTLTTGNMKALAVHVEVGHTEDEVLGNAAAVESGSEHPLARAIVMRAREESVSIPEATDFSTEAGFGARANIGGESVAVGRPAWLESRGFALSPELQKHLDELHLTGNTVVGVASGKTVVGLIQIADTLKESSAEAIAALQSLGLTTVMATGDHPSVASSIAHRVGIDRVEAGLTPEGKADLIVRLQAEGHQVAMVGDGINDAPALATANLGIAMGTGTDAAMSAGDLTITRGDLMGVADGIRLARKTLGTIRGNLFWAFAYNVAAIPLAVAAVLNPVVAGLAMAFSSVFVVTNSLRLRSFRPTR